MDTSDLIDQYARWLRAGGRSPDTVELRLYHIRRALLEVPIPPAHITDQHLIEWLGSNEWKPSTLRSFRASLRVFYAWMQSAGLRGDNPAGLLPAVSVPRGRPRPTPDLIYRAAVASAAARVQVMIKLAAMCGLRRGEIARLRGEDYQPALIGHTLRVVGKGGHIRIVPVPDVLEYALADMPAGWWFPSPSGGHLTPAHVGKLVSATMPDGWTCHTLRHRCATVAYRAEHNLRAVQELLGHAKPETTALYTEIPDDDLRRAVNAAAA